MGHRRFLPINHAWRRNTRAFDGKVENGVALVRLSGRGYKIDKYGFISVNTHCSLKTNGPFVLASQAEQVFYVNDIVDEDWLIFVKTSPRDLFNMPNEDVMGPSSKRNVTGRYRGKEVNKLTKNGEKIEIDLAKGMKRVVGAKARMVANQCGNVLRSTVSLRDCITWNQVTAKYGEVTMRKMKDMFKPREGRDEDISRILCDGHAKGIMNMEK
ncbi:uncharacterized protein G2W53_045030 [Senna tora]|uniref:DUF4216 domain-containing protein n=1 Tax=Senna tora TaxID=362788 RepID=A0A834SDZ6_9FABA|nr:uncharacterized protein G2W53_045030 [Senna tora]